VNNHCILDKEFQLQDSSFWFQSVPPWQFGGSWRESRTTFFLRVQISLSSKFHDWPAPVVAKNLLQRVTAVYVLSSTSVENETEHYRLWQRKKGGTKLLLLLAGKRFVHAIVESKRDTSDKHAKMDALRMVPYFLLSFERHGRLLWCKD
jgi:hypothetical protein